MQIAIVLYPGLTALDAVGPYETLRLLPDAEVRFIGAAPGPVVADSGVLFLGITHSYDETPSPDVVLVPGSGPRTATAMTDWQLLDWLRRVHETTQWTTSVCTGAMILAAAGILDGMPATTHWMVQPALAAMGAKARRGERIVHAGKVATAAGVSAGPDLGLWLVGELAGQEQAEIIQLYIEYDPHPPVQRWPPEQGEQGSGRQGEGARPQDRAQLVRGAGGPHDRLAASAQRVPQTEGVVMNRGWMMKLMVLVAIALVALAAPAAAQQSELGGKVRRAGREVVIPAGETVQGDLIATAGTVRVDGRVDGDLVASGGQVIVAGTVTGDALVGAGSTTISGEVGGDLRAGAGQARIEGRVGEDVLLGAGQATVAPESRIAGDLIFATGRMQMNGAVAGSVLGSTGNYTEAGSVGGTQRVNLQQPEGQQAPTLADGILTVLRRYVSILVVGLLLLWLWPRLFRGAAEVARGRPLVAFGVGLLAFIGVIVTLILVALVTALVAIVLALLGLGSLSAVTVFGGVLIVAIIAFVFVLAVGFAAQATIGNAIGRLLLRGQDRSFLAGLGALAPGVLVVALLAAIPLVGGILEALVVLLGLGALVLVARRHARRQVVAEPMGSASRSAL